jgi:hypothetical protein
MHYSNTGVYVSGEILTRVRLTRTRFVILTIILPIASVHPDGALQVPTNQRPHRARGRVVLRGFAKRLKNHFDQQSHFLDGMRGVAHWSA